MVRRYNTCIAAQHISTISTMFRARHTSQSSSSSSSRSSSSSAPLARPTSRSTFFESDDDEPPNLSSAATGASASQLSLQRAALRQALTGAPSGDSDDDEVGEVSVGTAACIIEHLVVTTDTCFLSGCGCFICQAFNIKKRAYDLVLGLGAPSSGTSTFFEAHLDNARSKALKPDDAAGTVHALRSLQSEDFQASIVLGLSMVVQGQAQIAERLATVESLLQSSRAVGAGAARVEAVQQCEDVSGFATTVKSGLSGERTEVIENPLFFLVKGQQVSFITTMGGDEARALIHFKSPGGTVTNSRVNKKVTNYTTCVTELVRDYKEGISAAAKGVVLAIADDLDPKLFGLKDYFSVRFVTSIPCPSLTYKEAYLTVTLLRDFACSERERHVYAQHLLHERHAISPGSLKTLHLTFA